EAAVSDSLGAPPSQRGSKASWLFAYFAVLFAVSGVLGTAMHGKEEAIVGFALMLLGGTVGTLLSHIKVLPGLHPRNGVIDRAVGASIAFACMLPGYAVGSDGGAGRMIVPLTAALIICNWNKRADSGRAGIINGGAAWSPAIVGLIFGGSSGGVWVA